MALDVIVLAGGLGTRLRPAVADVPKCLAPVAGRPFIEHVIEHLANQGFCRVILATGYLAHLVVERLGERFANVELLYSTEDTPLGTGGAVRSAMQLVSTAEALVLNGDTWVEVDSERFLATHRRAQAVITIGITHVQDAGRYGTVRVEDDRVVAFEEKGRAGPGWINAGAYVMARQLFEAFGMPDRFSLESDFLTPHVGALRPAAYRLQGAFIDIGVPSDFAAAQLLLASRHGSKGVATDPPRS